MKTILAFIISFFVIQSASAQQLTQWKAYTSFRQVTGVSVSSDNVAWASTTGGVYSFDGEGVLQTFTTVENTHRLDGTAIIADAERSRIFVGYLDGTIDIISSTTGEIERLEDIRRAENFSPRGINDFAIIGNNLYVATDFGIVNYDLNSLVVKDSFTKLGSFDRGITVNTLFARGDTLFAGTLQGLALGGINTPLELAENWTNFDQTNGFTSQSVLAAASVGNVIYASTASENFRFDGTNWQINTPFNQGVITGYSVAGNTLWAVDSNQAFRLRAGGELQIVALGDVSGVGIFAVSDTQSLAATQTSGVLVVSENEEPRPVLPDGPFSNLFDGLRFDGDILIAGSSSGFSANSAIDRAKGFYIFDDGNWTNVNQFTNQVLNQNRFTLTFTSAATSDFYYFGSWGSGVARMDKQTGDVQIFNASNSNIVGWEQVSVTFPVMTGLEADNNNDVWALSRFADRPLYVQSPGSDSWINLPPTPGISSQDRFSELFIDAFNQKWITLQSTTTLGRGLLVLDTGDPEDASDDRFVKLTEDINNGFLPNLQVKAFAQDRNGEVWVGTERGITRYIFPEFIIDGGPNERRGQLLINEDTTGLSRILLRDVSVSALEVNGANQKWIGSENEGVWLVNAGGTRILKQFNTGNSPLFSNSIKSIAIHEKTGEVFFATDLGLISFTDIPTGPVSDMDNLKVFPNPFRYAAHDKVVIEGLSESTIVRVLGVDGTLINQIEAFGGRVEWNGLDFNGKRLGSGVYLVVATEKNGSDRGVGKIAIIR